MRRRRDESDGWADVPRDLVRFTPSDWPGRGNLERCLAWQAARRDYCRENGWPATPLSLVLENVRTRRDASRATGSHQPSPPPALDTGEVL